jgi:transcriptional regulator with XRE-family HTH domain
MLGMDVKLDSAVIRAERGRRGWSQEQLAAAAGLGVRTIQRIESSGTASAESAKCLAAVFELSVADLVAKRPALPARRRAWAAAATVFVAVVSSLFLMSRANATNVAMAVVLGTQATGESRMNVEVQSGQQTEITLERDVRLLLTPTIRKDGTIALSVELYGWDGGEFTLVGKPQLLMRQDAETRLQLDLHNGQTARISITPKAK